MLFQWAAVTFSIHTPFKVLFFVKNIGQWNAKSGPKAAYGNFAMRKKNSGSLKKKWKRKGRNGSHFAHTHTHSAKLVVRMPSKHNVGNVEPVTFCGEYFLRQISRRNVYLLNAYSRQSPIVWQYEGIHSNKLAHLAKGWQRTILRCCFIEYKFHIK